MNRWFDKFPFLSKYLPGKIILSIFMFLLAVVLHIFSIRSDRIVCVYAMFFAFVGDVALNYYPDFRKPSKRDFYYGAVAFGLAQLSYAYAYALKMRMYHLPFFNAGLLFAVLLMAVIICYFITKCQNKLHTTKARIGLIYLILSAINYMIIFSYGVSAGVNGMLAIIGALMFLASDVIIGLESFTGFRYKWARDLVWWLYPIGQILIILMA